MAACLFACQVCSTLSSVSLYLYPDAPGRLRNYCTHIISRRSYGEVSRALGLACVQSQRVLPYALPGMPSTTIRDTPACEEYLETSRSRAPVLTDRIMLAQCGDSISPRRLCLSSFAAFLFLLLSNTAISIQTPRSYHPSYSGPSLYLSVAPFLVAALPGTSSLPYHTFPYHPSS